MILVTGATGTVGSEVVKQLLEAGQKVRAMVRDPGKAKLDPRVEVVRGDLDKPETLDAVVAGVDKAFLLASGADLERHTRNFVEAAKKAGVKHIVKLSVMGAAFEPGIIITRWHRAAEKVIEGSGIAWTFIRPTGFMSNALTWVGSIKNAGGVYQPTGQAKASFVHPRDIATAAVTALLKPGHEGKAYDLATDVLSYGEAVKKISDAIGKPIQYVDVPEAAARDAMLKMGMDALTVDGLLEFMGLVKAGYTGNISPDFEKLTGKKGLSFDDWLKENVQAFR